MGENENGQRVHDRRKGTGAGRDHERGENAERVC